MNCQKEYVETPKRMRGETVRGGGGMTGDSAIMVRVASPPRVAAVKARAERRETGKWLGMKFETN